MLAFILQRREELKMDPLSAAMAVETGGVGSVGNTAHLNRTQPMGLPARSFIYVTPRKS